MILRINSGSDEPEISKQIGITPHKNRCVKLKSEADHSAPMAVYTDFLCLWNFYGWRSLGKNRKQAIEEQYQA